MKKCRCYYGSLTNRCSVLTRRASQICKYCVTHTGRKLAKKTA